MKLIASILLSVAFIGTGSSSVVAAVSDYKIAKLTDNKALEMFAEISMENYALKDLIEKKL